MFKNCRTLTNELCVLTAVVYLHDLMIKTKKKRFTKPLDELTHILTHWKLVV